MLRVRTTSNPLGGEEHFLSLKYNFSHNKLFLAQLVRQSLSCNITCFYIIFQIMMQTICTREIDTRQISRKHLICIKTLLLFFIVNYFQRTIPNLIYIVQ